MVSSTAAANGLVQFILLWTTFVNLINGDAFLKQKPNFLETCQRNDSDFAKCLARAYQHIFSDWKHGVTGVEKPKSIDPLYVDEFAVIEDRENVTPISVKLRNITVTGLSEAHVRNVSIKDNDFNFKMTYAVPKIRLDGQYMAQGQILLLKIDTHGKMLMEITNGVYTIVVKMKISQRDEYKFFDLKSLQFKVNSIENVKLNFANLFKDKTLNDNTNAVFNESWRVFFDVFKPKIEKEINAVLLAHFGSVFENVPATFFIADL